MRHPSQDRLADAAHRWTFVAEYDGGTYISQTRAETLATAVMATKESNELEFWACLTKNDLDDAVSVDGAANVWCFSGLHENKLVLVHAVLTASE